MSKFTTIRITKEKKRKLDDMGKKSDTHDDIVGKLIENFEKNHKKKRNNNGAS